MCEGLQLQVHALQFYRMNTKFERMTTRISFRFADAFWSGFIAGQHGAGSGADAIAHAGTAPHRTSNMRICIHYHCLHQHRILVSVRLMMAFFTSSRCLSVRHFSTSQLALTPLLVTLADVLLPGVSECLLPFLEPQQALGWLRNCR